MKIGIITLPLISNYGGILQNFALQYVLKSLGHTPVTIDLDLSPSYLRYVVRTVHLSLQKWKFTLPDTLRRNEKVWPFMKTNLALTERVHKYSDCKELSDFECFIVGSDQIWNYNFNKPVVFETFLSFASEGSRKIAYAVSMGSSQWKYPQKITKRLCRYVSRFDCISVRETSAKILCKENLNIETKVVLDPTLLVPTEIYKNLASPRLETEDYILVYVLDQEAEKVKYINKIAKQLNRKVVNVTELRHGGYSVEDWLSLFLYADFVVTDSYHGTVFSIIFNRDFITLNNSKRGSDRFVTLLSHFGLDDRLVYSYEQGIDLLKTINWEAVNQSMDLHAEESLQFLRNALTR